MRPSGGAAAATGQRSLSGFLQPLTRPPVSTAFERSDAYLFGGDSLGDEAEAFSPARASPLAPVAGVRVNRLSLSLQKQAREASEAAARAAAGGWGPLAGEAGHAAVDEPEAEAEHSPEPAPAPARPPGAAAFCWVPAALSDDSDSDDGGPAFDLLALPQHTPGPPALPPAAPPPSATPRHSPGDQEAEPWLLGGGWPAEEEEECGSGAAHTAQPPPPPSSRRRTRARSPLLLDEEEGGPGGSQLPPGLDGHHAPRQAPYQRHTGAGGTTLTEKPRLSGALKRLRKSGAAAVPPQQLIVLSGDDEDDDAPDTRPPPRRHSGAARRAQASPSASEDGEHDADGEDLEELASPFQSGDRVSPLPSDASDDVASSDGDSDVIIMHDTRRRSAHGACRPPVRSDGHDSDPIELPSSDDEAAAPRAIARGASPALPAWRSRLPHYTSVGEIEASDFVISGEEVHIDYRNQFNGGMGGARRRSSGGEGGAGAGAAPRKKRKSSGEGGRNGHWETEGGRKVFILPGGERLQGKKAYKAWQESGKT